NWRSAMDATRQATGSGHLWAIGYDDMERAEQVRDKITTLGWGGPHFLLSDVSVAVRHPDGSLTIDREPFPAVAGRLRCAAAGFIAGLVVAAPLTGAAIGVVLGGAGTAAAANIGIADHFVREVEAIMKPGTSVLFVLDSEGDMDLILHTIRGLGGTVLKTNMDTERAKLIQATLSGPRFERGRPGTV